MIALCCERCPALPSAGGTIGGAFVAQAAADGCTFMLSYTTPIALGPLTLDKLPYGQVEVLTHVSYLGAAQLVILFSPRVGIANVAVLQASVCTSMRRAHDNGPDCWCDSAGHRRDNVLRVIF